MNIKLSVDLDKLYQDMHRGCSAESCRHKELEQVVFEALTDDTNPITKERLVEIAAGIICGHDMLETMAHVLATYAQGFFIGIEYQKQQEGGSSDAISVNPARTDRSIN